MANPCSKCLETEKKLKIAKSDYDFELKKIQQDKSTEKALFEIHLQKEVKRWQELHEKEKNLREDEVKKWMINYDSTVERYECLLKELKESLTQNAETRIQELRSRFEEKQRIENAFFEEQRQKAQKGFEECIVKLNEEHNRQIAKINKENEQYVSNIKKSHKVLIEEKTKAFESKLLGVESEKNKELKLHEQTKSDSKQIQAKLYHESFNLRKVIIQLQSKVSEQAKTIQKKSDQIEQLEGQISNLRQQHDREIEELKRAQLSAMDDKKRQYKEKLSGFYQETLDHCKQYENAIEDIQKTRVNERVIYLNNIEEINTFVESRASRPEDQEEMEYLRASLLKKTKQCDCLSEQLKFIRLEQENKEEVYNKILVPVTHPNNESFFYKRRELKLRRQGKSVSTVRQALQSINSSHNIHVPEKKSTNPYLMRPKVL